MEPESDAVDCAQHLRFPMRRRHGWSVVAVALALLTLAACGSGSSAPPPTATPAPPSPTATPVPVTIGEIVWTAALDPDSGAPTEPLDTMSNALSEVHAAVPVPVLPTGAVFEARWSIDGQPLPDLAPAPVVVEREGVDGWVTFTLRWMSEEPWPIGSLGIEVIVAGEVVGTDSIPIVWPDPEG